MPQIGGKPLKKSSKTKSKSSSTSKRHFTVVIGTKEHGLYCSSSPSSAARKAVSKLCGKNVKNVEFCLREITQGSKKKTYGPYLGHIEKLAKPIQLKGRLVERTPVVRLKPKSSAKKGGMRGGRIKHIVIGLGNCGKNSNSSENGCITLIHYRNKVVFYYNERSQTIEVRYFENSKNIEYYGEPVIYDLDNFNILEFDTILANLIDSPNVKFEIKELKELVNKIISFIADHNENLPHWPNILPFFNKLLDPSDKNLSYFVYRQHMQNKSRQVKVTELNTINEGNENNKNS
jgi:hypothetical protein